MKQPLIRTIYLYLFALIGLVLITIGAVKLTNLALKAFIFTKADQELNYNLKPPVISFLPDGKTMTEENLVLAIEKCQEKCDLTVEQKQEIANWLKDYKNWQEQESKFDYLVQQRQREISQSLAMILVGLPLYLYHWTIIKKETEKEI